MKRKMMYVTGAVLILLMIAVTGCGKTNATSSGSSAGNETGGTAVAGPETAAGADNTKGAASGAESTTGSLAGNANAGETASGSANTTESSSDSEMSYTMISEEEAKVIALKDANVSENDVSGIRIKREKDNGIWQYEVDFYVGDTEYDYDIDASTGQILSKDMEINDDFRSAGEGRSSGGF